MARRQPLTPNGTLLLALAVAQVGCAGSRSAASDVLWTTPDNSDTCQAYPSQVAPPRARFETKQECEHWVAKRLCRPDGCFDGCNWHTCDIEGQSSRTTMKRCVVGTSVMIRFAPGSAELDQPPDWNELHENITRLFRVEERMLYVVGHASTTETASEAERKQLGQRRAQVVQGELVARGFAPQRIHAELYDPPLGQLDHELPRVSFRVVPDYPRRNDLNPKSNEYRDYCDQ